MTLPAAPTAPADQSLPDGAWWLDVHELRSDYAPAYGDTWDEAIQLLLSDPGDRDVVERLRGELAAGRLREPVRVDPVEKVVLNGMHRSVAAMTTGTSRIPVSALEPDDAITCYAEVTFDMTLDADLADRYEDPLDAASSLLRSFPVGSRWTEAVGLGSSYGTLDSWYVWPWDDLDVLAGALVARGAQFGASVTIRDVRRCTEDEDG